MDNRLHPLRASQRLLTYLVCGLIAWQPLLPAISATINPVTRGTNMDKAANGVPVMNIATPNGAGISHNQFKDYNVGKEGLILNNATGQLNKTQLGGYIQNNTNLTAGREAKGIINEVTGGSRSQLQGYTEVAGKAANVIVANPYGITCSGCGFINTPNATLTTGKPVFDARGNLQSLDVSKGTITVEGQGLDASQSDALSIISRATEVNAAIHAKDLKVVAGANRVGSDGSVTAIAGEGAAPVVAVDTGALGGMYANRIHLVSGEKGVGVNLGNLNARQGDITLDASGKLVLNNSLSSGALTAKAESVELGGDNKATGAATVTAQNGITLNNGALVSDKTVALDGGESVQLSGAKVAAGGDIRLSGSELALDNASTVNAAGNISLTAQNGITQNGGSLVSDKTVALDGGSRVQLKGTKVTAGEDVRLTGTALTLDNTSTADAAGNISLTAQDSAAGASGLKTQTAGTTTQGEATGVSVLDNAGQLTAGKALSLQADAVSNRGTLAAKGRLDAESKSVDNLGTVQGSGVTLNADALRNSGTLQSAGALALSGSTLEQSGTLGATGDAVLDFGDRINNAQGGSILADGTLSVTSGELVQDGTLSGRQGLTADSNSLSSAQGAQTRSLGDVTLKVRDKTDILGDVNAGGTLALNSGSLRTGSGAQLQGQNVSLTAGSAELKGTQAAQKKLDVTAQTLAHGGKSSADSIILNASGTLNNSGSLVADTALQATAAELTNSGTGSAGDIILKSTGTLNNSGALAAKTRLQATAGALNNSGTLSASLLGLESSAITNGGLLQGTQSLSLLSQSLDNQKSGSIATAGDLALDLADFTNSGLLSSGRALSLSGERLTNSGEINAASLTSDSVTLNNLAGGRLLATGAMQLTNAQLDNAGQIAADGLAVSGGTLTNSGGIQGTNGLTLKTDSLTNRNNGELLTGGTLTLNSGELANDGLVQGDTLDVTADNWRNGGNALSAQDATVKVKGTLTNSGQILGQQKLDVSAADTDNSGLVVAKVLALHGDLVNSGLLQGDSSLVLAGTAITNNSGGQLLSAGNTRVTAGTLDNQGELQADTLDVTVKDWNNSGSTRAASGLSAKLAGQLENSGTLRSSQTLELQAADIRNGGTLAADRLTLRAPQLSNSGTLQGSSALVLDTDALSNLSGAQLLSGKGLTLNLDTLNNDGLLQVSEALDVQARRFTNTGSVQAAQLGLDIAGTLLNGAAAALLAEQDATVKAQTLDNGGTLAASALTLSGDTLTNRGAVQGDNALSATFGQLTNASGGTLLSGGNMTLNAADASNDGSWQAQQLELNADSFTNTGSVNGIAALTGSVTGLLDNRGALNSQGAAGLQAGSLRNSGKMLADSLTLQADTLQNSGLWQGSNQLSATGDTLTTDAGSRTLTNGALTLTAGQLTTDGTLQGQQATISADDWRHPGSLLGSGSLLAQVANQLTSSGELMSQGDTRLNAATLNNSGSLLGSGDITLSGGSLTNSGSVQGKTLTLTPAQIVNRGKLIGIEALTLGAPAVAGRMLLAAVAQPARELRNEQGGSLLTQGDLTVKSGGVTNNGSWQAQNILLNADALNNGGAIQSAGNMQLVLGNTLTSAAGSKISAGGTAALQALALTNSGEWIAKNLTLKADTLTSSGSVSGVSGLTLDVKGLNQQQGGSLLSGGALTLTLPELNNQGRIQAATLQINGNTLTNSGTLQGDNGLTLNMRDRLTNNASGTLLSQQGLTLTAPELVNYGLIQGGTTSTLTATGSARNEGRILNGGQLTLTTPQLTNGGWLQATSLILNAATAGNSGTLLAQQQGTLTGNTLTNTGTAQGGSLAVNYQQLSNSGTVLGGNALTVTAQQVNQQAAGKLFSGGSLVLNSNGFDQLGQVVALGDATLKLINSLNVRGTLAAGGKLTAGSNGELVNNGVMQGQALNISAGSVLTNNGKLTSGSGDSTLSGSRIAMNSAGSLQGGGNVTLTSGSDITLNGFTGTAGTMTLNAPGSIVNTALLYAANNLYLLANSIKNQSGDILAGNNLWMQRDMAGNANSEILNTSGTIETTSGDITLKTGHLLNQWESVTVGQTTTENLATNYTSTSPGTVELPVSLFDAKDLYYYTYHVMLPTRLEDDWTFAGLLSSVTYKETAVSRVTSSTITTGQAGRISSGGNLTGEASRLDNLGSYLLARKDLVVSGGVLNNQSYLSGTQTVWRKYAPTAEALDPKLAGKEIAGYYYNDPTYSGYYKQDNNRLMKDTLTFTATDEYRTEGSSSIRGVIQANGNVTTRFNSIVNNSESTDVRGTITPTLARPGLQTLAQQSINGSVAAQGMAAFNAVAINSPEWHDQLQGAIQQVNGGGNLDNIGGQATNLASYPQGSVNLSADGTTTALVNNPYSQSQQLTGAVQGKTVDTSAYPLPQGSNGYFTASDDPKSPYLITINPKLNGLGELDKNLYGDLYQLLNMQPADAPAETRQQYTDKNAFLGSSYLLDRLNLKPEYDYRILGDAAFDTRYVSNAVLSQTGNRYINGIGSDLDQMKYLMDNAATAQQSLGLTMGVTLTADQIASLDHSILWWEAATINGETVLVPKLYLSPGDVTVNNGSVIAGNNVVIEGNSVSNNGSTLLAQQGMAINSQNSIDNLNAALIKAGEGLQLSAMGDINNIGSAISGKQVALESLDGSINNLTLTSQTNNKSRWSSYQITEQDEKATITSLDSLSLTAGKNLTLASADITAGGNTKLSAAGNIDVLANDNTATLKSRSLGNNYHTVSSTASNIKSGGTLSVFAGNDLTVEASNINATKDTALIADGEINFLSSENTLNNSPRSWDRTSQKKADSTSLSAGGALTIAAGKNLTVEAGNIDAAKDLTLSAAGDIKLLSTANTTSNNYFSQSSYDNSHDVSTLTSGGSLTMTAGRDVISEAAGMAAEDNVTLQAGRDIALQSEATAEGSHREGRNTTEIKKSVRQQGTEIAAGGDVAIQAGRDLTSNATQVVAQQDISVGAENNINLNTATESDYYYKKEVSSGGGFLSKKTTTKIQEDSSTREKGTLLSGNNVSVEAGKNILVNGSQVVGDEEVALKAGDNIDILAATNTNSSWRFSETKKSGLMSTGGIGISIGSSKTVHDLKQKGTTQSQSVSTVGSTGGNVSIVSGGQVHLNGSDLVAGKGITVDSDNILVTAGHDKHITDEIFKQSTSGLTLALSGAVGDAINSAVAAAQAASEQSDGRLAALQGAKAALSGVQASQATRMDAAKGGDPSNTSTVGIMLSLGAQSSKSQSHSEQDTTRSSTLNAGNNLTLTASGKGQTASSGDINVEGGQLKAGQDVTLDAARDITLQAAKDTQLLTGSNSSKGGSIGIGLTAGSGGTGLTISASMNASKGNEKGNGTSWNETNIDAGNQVNLISGRDTTLSGALVNGDKVVADVGRDLTLTSLQDSNNYDSKQQSVSAGASFTWGVPGGSASFSYSRDKMHSTYDSVQEQTGIYAGNGGFDITVGSHTQLNGAVIASNADTAKNSLDTGTLGFSDIHNEADYKVEHQGVGISTSASMGAQAAMNMASNLLAGAGGSGHAEGTTQSAVANGTITVRDQANQKQDVAELSRDTANANGAINQIFDKEKEQKRLQTAQLIGELGSQMAQVAQTEGQIAAITAGKAELAKKNIHEPASSDEAAWKDYNAQLAGTQSYKDEMKQWGTGSDIQRAIQATTAVVQGLAGGDIAAAVAGGAAPYIANVIAQKIPEDNLAGRVLAHATVNAALAAVQGKDMAAAAAGAATGEIAAAIALNAYGKKVSELDESEKQTISALATLASGLAGGLAGDSGADAVAGAQAGKTTAENNFLSVTQLENFAHRARTCEGESCKDVVREMVETNVQQQKELMDFCSSNPGECEAKYGYLVEQWQVFDQVIRKMDADGTLPNDFKNYLMAVYSSGVDAETAIAAPKWEKMLEEKGIPAESAKLMAATLPLLITGAKGAKNSSVASLPKGYVTGARGTVVGPKGGVYTSTGKLDAEGNAIYSNNGAYYTFSNGAKTTVASPNPPSPVNQRYEQGKAFEDKYYGQYSADKAVSARELSVKTEGGTTVRIDMVGKDANGKLTCVECKSSATAPLTKNQKVGYPEIEKSGATVIGAGRPGFETGTKIPPTKVEIVRPDTDK